MPAIRERARLKWPRMRGLPWDTTPAGVSITRQSNAVMSSAVIELLTGRHMPTPVGEVDFDAIACRLASRKFCGQRQITISEIECTLLVYFTGRVVCAGTGGLLDACAAMAGAVQLMRKYQRPGGAPFTLGAVTAVNCVSHGEFPFGLSLAALYKHLYDIGMSVSYTPNAFRGIRLWINLHDGSTDKRVALLFATGKFILTGFKTLPDTERAAAFLDNLIRAVPAVHTPKPSIVSFPKTPNAT
jgi:TATA-box binding protein (TBP) (component of TFIID and TFIIIB)